MKTLDPELGKRKLAPALARAGLHLGDDGGADLEGACAAAPRPVNEPAETGRKLIAQRQHEVWHIDLTVVPTGAGFWVPWRPFGWWVAAVADSYSKRVLQLGCFVEQPTSADVQNSWHGRFAKQRFGLGT